MLGHHYPCHYIKVMFQSYNNCQVVRSQSFFVTLECHLITIHVITSQTFYRHMSIARLLIFSHFQVTLECHVIIIHVITSQSFCSHTSIAMLLIFQSLDSCTKMLGRQFPCHLHCSHFIVIKMTTKSSCHSILSHGCDVDEIQSYFVKFIIHQ